MCSIPCAQRIAGRYVYRRRVHFRNMIAKPLTLALRPADPAAARQRAAMLSAQFVTVNIRVKTMMQQGAPLTGEPAPIGSHHGAQLKSLMWLPLPLRHGRCTRATREVVDRSARLPSGSTMSGAISVSRGSPDRAGRYRRGRGPRDAVRDVFPGRLAKR